jgi:tetratricopeptide (TPR) repeat protein
VEPLDFDDTLNGAPVGPPWSGWPTSVLGPEMTFSGLPGLGAAGFGLPVGEVDDWLPPDPPQSLPPESPVVETVEAELTSAQSPSWLLGQWLDLGLQQFDAGNYAGAIEAFERCLELEPADSVARQGRAIALVGLGSYAEALPDLEDLITQLPQQVDLWGNYGHALAGMGRYDEALAAYRHILTIDPNVVTAWLDCGRVLQQMERWSDAANAYDRALNLQPTHAPAWYARGLLQKKLGQRSLALEAFERTLSIDPYCKEAWNYRGTLLEDLGRPTEAREAYQRAIDLDPQYAEAWNNLGIALENQQAYNEALEAFRKSLECDPYNPDVWNNCGLTLDSLNRLAEAVTAFDRSLSLTGNSYWKAWANRGWALWRLHGYAAALKNWNQGLESLDRSAADYALGCGILHYHKGRAHAEEGQRHTDPFPYWQEARLCFEQALTFLTPDRYANWYLEGVQGAIDTYRALGQTDRAQTLLHQATDLLRRMVRETDCTTQKVTLAAKLANFYQSGSSM